MRPFPEPSYLFKAEPYPDLRIGALPPDGATMFRAGFDPQATLTGHALALTPLVEGDFDRLFAVASDPWIWAGHPAKDRYRLDGFERYYGALVRTRGALVVSDCRSEAVIGCSAFYQASDQADGISVGFTFLCRAVWGGPTNFELKRLMLEHAFKSYEEVWFHIDPSNVRSQRATSKLGAEHAHDAVLAISGDPTLWMCFRLSRHSWARVVASRRGSGGA